MMMEGSMSSTAVMAMLEMSSSSSASALGGISTRTRHQLRRSELCGMKLGLRLGRMKSQHIPHTRCSSSSRNEGNGAGEQEDYLPAQVESAVSMLPLHGRLFMTLFNEREVEVKHVNPSKGRLLYKARSHAIFLKVESEPDILLPIIVGELAVSMLMKALHGEERLKRPNYYQLLKHIAGALDYEAKMVKITERVNDTYFARIYFGQDGKKELTSVDARPSDAINFAVRCKIPIYVNKSIIDSDAVTPVYTTTNWESPEKKLYLDIPVDNHDPIVEEITLMKDMLMAVVEERYADAARYRDQLNKLRLSSKMKQSF